jgi:holo-[acyl-carrier protein] synthase
VTPTGGLGQVLCFKGLGVDIVSIQRVSGMLDKSGARFLATVLTRNEIKDITHTGKSTIAERVAGRIACKEAVFKSLSTADRLLQWQEIEILPAASGAPEARLTGSTMKFAAASHIEQIKVSISHDGQYAMAAALAIGRSTPQSNYRSSIQQGDRND